MHIDELTKIRTPNLQPLVTRGLANLFAYEGHCLQRRNQRNVNKLGLLFSVFLLSVIHFDASFVRQAEAIPVVWRAEYGGNGNAYDFVASSIRWETAAALAQQSSFGEVNGHLTTITSASENAFILSNFGILSESSLAWIGGHEPSDDGVWLWGFGPEVSIQFSQESTPVMPFNYANWGASEPNDDKPGEDFAMFNLGEHFRGIAPGEWGDAIDSPNSEDPVVGYLIEYETRIPERTGGMSFTLGERSEVRDGEILSLSSERDRLLFQPGDTAPFDSFHGCDAVCDPGRHLDVEFTFQFDPKSLDAAAIRLGLFDHDAWAPGQQIAYFGVDGIDLTQLLSGLVEQRPNHNWQYNIYEIEMPEEVLNQLADGSVTFQLRYGGPPNNDPNANPDNNYGLIDFATLTVWPDPIPEPATFVMLMIAVGTLASTSRNNC